MTRADREIEKEAKRPDMFLSTTDQLFNTLWPFRHVIFGLIGVGVVGSLGFGGYQFFQNRKETAAQEALYSVEANYTELRDQYNQAEANKKAAQEQQKTGKKTPPPELDTEAQKAIPASGDLTKDYGPVLQKFAVVLNEHPGTDAAVLAAIHSARIYYDYNQLDKANEFLQKATPMVGPKNILAGFLYSLRGDVQAANNKCDEAIRDWQYVLDSKYLAFFQPDIELKKGLCLETLGRTSEAEQVYRKLSLESASTMAGRSAKKYLRLLTMKQ